jgi:hypothetical protein
MKRLRQKLIDLTQQYKNAWFPELGGHLHKVKSERLYRNWSGKDGRTFGSFSKYCQHDLHISSTVASDMARAYEYIATCHRHLITKFPSDGKTIPGYNEIVMLLRAQRRIPENKFMKLDRLLFTNGIGREKLRRELSCFAPKTGRKLKQLQIQVMLLRARVRELEAEIDELRDFGFHTTLTGSEVNRITRTVAPYIHLDKEGGSNQVMRDFNSFMDRVLASVNTN